MVQIRSLGNTAFQQVVALLNRYGDSQCPLPQWGAIPGLALALYQLSQVLPLGLKFMPAIHIALEKGNVLALVSLHADGHKRDRWIIDQIIGNPEASAPYDVGKQLLESVIHRYGTLGVETFLAFKNPEDTVSLGLFKESGFRHCTKRHTFQLRGIPEDLPTQSIDLSALREVRRTDVKALQDLHTETLPPEIRVSLQSAPADLILPFWRRFQNGLQGRFHKTWVIPSPHESYLLASLTLSTWDYKLFWMDIFLSPAWDEGMASVLTFALQQMTKSTRSPQVWVHVYDYQKSFQEALLAKGFERIKTVEVLVKDYWIPLSGLAESRNPVLLFTNPGGTSPA